MSSRRKFTLGVIGAGTIGRQMAAAMEQAQDVVHVCGIWDPDPAAMARVAGELAGIPLAASADALTEAADCVYVASPPATHLDHARGTLEAGKALFCEKPLAVEVSEARAFVAAAASSRAAVNYPFASSPAAHRLREWIAEGVVGTPAHLAIEVAFASWPRAWQRNASSWLDGPIQGGFTREVASHFLFLSRRLLGPLSLNDAQVSFPEHGRSERSVRARLMAGGIPTTLAGDIGTTDLDDHNTWTLHGNAGAIQLRDWSIAERLNPDGTWQTDPDSLPNEQLRPVVLRRQIDGVAQMVRGSGHHLATLAEAYEVLTVVEAILTA